MEIGRDDGELDTLTDGVKRTVDREEREDDMSEMTVANCDDLRVRRAQKEVPYLFVDGTAAAGGGAGAKVVVT